MTLFDMYEMIEFFSNKDYGGAVLTPEKYNSLLIKSANLDLLKIKLGLPEDYQPGQAVPRQHINATQLQSDDLRVLKEHDLSRSVSGGVIAYPDDYITIDAIRYNYQRSVDGTNTTIPKIVEILTEDQYGDRAGNWIKKPSVTNPVGVCRKDGIYVYPASISTVEFHYIKYPTDPIFAYTENVGYITYDAPGSTEFVWPKHLHMDLVRIMLGYLSINIREQELLAYAETLKEKGA